MTLKLEAYLREMVSWPEFSTFISHHTDTPCSPFKCCCCGTWTPQPQMIVSCLQPCFLLIFAASGHCSAQRCHRVVWGLCYIPQVRLGGKGCPHFSLLSLSFPLCIFFFVEEEKGEQSSAHSSSGQMGETLGGRYKKTDYIAALQQLQPWFL